MERTQAKGKNCKPDSVEPIQSFVASCLTWGLNLDLWSCPVSFGLNCEFVVTLYDALTNVLRFSCGLAQDLEAGCGFRLRSYSSSSSSMALQLLVLSTISFHLRWSCTCSAHCISFIFFRSFLTSSSHRDWGLPAGLPMNGFHLCILFTVLISGILFMCPNQLNRWASRSVACPSSYSVGGGGERGRGRR